MAPQPRPRDRGISSRRRYLSFIIYLPALRKVVRKFVRQTCSDFPPQAGFWETERVAANRDLSFLYILSLFSALTASFRHQLGFLVSQRFAPYHQRAPPWAITNLCYLVLMQAPPRLEDPRLSAKALVALPPSPSVIDCCKLLCDTVGDSATGSVGHQRTSITTLDYCGPGAWTTPGRLFTPGLSAVDKYKPEYYRLDILSCSMSRISLYVFPSRKSGLFLVLMFAFGVAVPLPADIWNKCRSS
jgi:hypothetical protein